MKVFAYIDKVAPDTLQLVVRPDPDPGPHVVIRIKTEAQQAVLALHRTLDLPATHDGQS